MTQKNPIFQTAFSRYEVDKLIGTGGNGEIYKVNDTDGNTYAIKKLSKDAAQKTEKIKRFKNEIYFCLKNRHINIVTVHDYGFVDDCAILLFYVMPLYSCSLRELINKKINFDEAFKYIEKIFDGVEAAHLLGIVHRDLKPENILIDSKTCNPVIADFGIASFSEESIITSVETNPNSRMANFQYAAPEQKKRGTKIEKSADIYALGLIVNEMFTGEIPHGTNYKTIESVCPEYGFLDEVVESMLRQNPEERPRTIDEIKCKVMALKNISVVRQHLSKLRNEVVPVSDIDDPLISNPIHLIKIDWKNNELIFTLSQSVNNEWISAIKNMGSYGSIRGKEPATFNFQNNLARVHSESNEVEKTIEYFKSWLPAANEIYKNKIINEQKKSEENQRRKLQAEIEKNREREEVLKKLEKIIL